MARTGPGAEILGLPAGTRSHGLIQRTAEGEWLPFSDMSVAECPFTTCHGHIVLEGHDPVTGERLGVCDACTTQLRERRGRWMDRDEPYWDP